MLGKVFSVLVITSFIFGAANGRMSEIGLSLISASSDAVTLCISLTGTMCFWNGMMRVLDKAGATAFFSKITKPLFRVIYSKEALENSLSFISASFAANFLGLGSAALPLGINTMKSLSKNKNRIQSVCDMATFATLSTVPLQLTPSTLIALRHAHGSANPFAIIVPVWVCSLITVAFTILLCRVFTYLHIKKDGKSNG